MSKYVCLSFDDGPNLGMDSTMNDMLDVLQKHSVSASFFLIGNKIDANNATVIKRAVEMGCDIENHSWSHPDMAKLSSKQILEEYKKTLIHHNNSCHPDDKHNQFYYTFCYLATYARLLGNASRQDCTSF